MLTVKLPPVLPPTRFKRIDLKVDRTWQPGVYNGILALDPGRITETDVRMTLAAGPTPRIMNLHGGIYPVHLVMESF